MQLDNIAAVITGGASGLGAATATALSERGALVFAIDLPKAVESAPPLEGVTYLAADVTDSNQVVSAMRRASQELPLRTIVNCAGIAPSARIIGRDGVHSSTLFAKVLQVNVLGTFNVMAHGADVMAKSTPDRQGQRGVIINTASIAAYEGQVGQTAYAASKSAVVGMTLPAARDLAQHGIRVCTIAPGIVNTPMLATISDDFRADLAAGVPFPQRLCEPWEYAELVAMIIRHDYLNGETIRMDGALRMPPR